MSTEQIPSQFKASSADKDDEGIVSSAPPEVVDYHPFDVADEDFLDSIAAIEGKVSVGHELLEEYSPRGPKSNEAATLITCIKSLEHAKMVIPGVADSDEESVDEYRMINLTYGSDLAERVRDAEDDFKSIVNHIADISELDPNTIQHLNAFVALYKETLIEQARWLGRAPSLEEKRHLLFLLIRDFGEYHGLICDDLEDSKEEKVETIEEFLHRFVRHRFHKPDMPLEERRLLPSPSSNEGARFLADYEISRSIPPHPVGLKEITVAGDEHGAIHDVNYRTHTLTVVYDKEIRSDEDRKALSTILPVFIYNVFDGFGSIDEARAYVEKRKPAIVMEQKKAYADIKCLEHFAGRVPQAMKKFFVDPDLRRRTRRKYAPLKDKEQRGRARTTIRRALDTIAPPVRFNWMDDVSVNVFPLDHYPPKPGDPEVVMPRYPDIYEFRMLEVIIKGEDDKQTPDDTYPCLCFYDIVRDPDKSVALVFEYQAWIDGNYYDAHAALRGQLDLAPRTLKKTLQLRDVLRDARDVKLPGETEAAISPEEYSLAGRICAYAGGLVAHSLTIKTVTQEAVDTLFMYPAVIAYTEELGER